MLSKPFTRNPLMSTAVAALEQRAMPAVMLRYALAPVCIVLAVLLYHSPIRPLIGLAGLFVFAVLAAAWFGGAGPGLVAAVLATFTLPEFVAVNYPLLGGVLDLPRFITFSIAGLAVGWWSYRRRQIEAALRESEQRYELAINASHDGFWDWVADGDKLYLSPRFLDMFGFAPGTTFAGHAAMYERLSMPQEDLAALQQAIADHFVGKTARMETEFRILVRGEVRWIHARGLATRDSRGKVVRWNGAARDVTPRRAAQDKLRESEARFRALTELSADWYWRQDEEHCITYDSRQAADTSLYPSEWVIGKRRWDLPGVTPLSFTWDEHRATLSACLPFRDLEYARVRLDGSTEYVSISGAPIFDEQGAFRGYQGVGRSITERKRADEALRSSEQRYALAMEAAGDGHTDWDLVSGEFYISPRLLEIVGHAPDATFADRADWVRRFPFHSDDRPKWESAIASHFAGRESHFKMELRIVVRGEVRWTAFHFLSTRNAAGEPIRWTGSIGDITEQKRAEEALRASEERYSLAMEAAEEGYIDSDVDTDRFVTSDRLNEIFGIPRGTRFADRSDFLRHFRFYGDDAKIYGDMIRAVGTPGGPDRYSFEFRIVLPSDEVRWLSTRGQVVRDADGRARRRVGVVTDITARKVAEEALRESQDRFARAVAGSYDGVWDIDFIARSVFFSTRTRELCGLPPGPEVVPLDGWFDALPLHPEDRPKRTAAVEAHLSGNAPAYEGEFRLLQPDGVYRWRHLRGVCVRDADGKPLRMAGSISDVDARRRVEDALRLSEERYELAMAASESGYWDWDILTGRYFVSERGNELAGFHADNTFADRTDFGARIPMHPEDWPKWEAARKELFAGTGERLSMECRYFVHGELRWHVLHAICRRDHTGKVIRWTGSSTNVTARKLAEEELKTMERKLRQAQRLEAMGTLAGGIAHDFNNILGAILGYGEMAARDAPKGSRLARDLDSIMVAGERGRALVDRVLAFSRSAVGERVPVHVERVAREAIDQVSARLPPGVTVIPMLHAGPAAVVGDATQVHQVVANLATNAVQAMQEGGTLRVELTVESVEAPRAATIGGLAAEEYVVLTVADTGAGIAPEVVDRIFDPFFTTKEVGTGTGLGLSLVHGIVSELGGAIDVASTPGTGSTFTVYLPRSGDAEEQPSDAEESDPPRGDGQRVLIVDDEEPLVQLATRTLADLGYVPIGFTSSAAALAAFLEDPGRFDALITDERMPEMSGSALIRAVRGIRDSMPVVLMSGYPGTSAAQGRDGGVGDALGVEPNADRADEVLQKPLSAHDLATSLARVLQL